jgi:hypothetical protein
MDIHKPKPWHGWREFLKEYLIIFIGVLTALGFEEGVQWLHWRSAVGEARAALRQEVAANATLALVDRQQSACILAKLGDDTVWAQGAPRPNIDARLLAPTSTVWDLTKAGQMASHMPVKEQLAYAGFYANVANLQNVIQSQRAVSARLVGWAEKTSFTPDEVARFSQDRSEMGAWYRGVLNNDGFLLAAAKALGVTPNPLPAQTRQRLADLCAPTS